MKWVRGEFRRHEAQLDAVYYCPHHPTHGLGEYLRDCDCRKPKPGMILAAQREWNIDLSRSLLIGDSPGDLGAGESAGVGRCMTIRAVSEGVSGGAALESGFAHDALDLLNVKPIGS